jgi:glycosyltransferase involved in cell wall biosynthesis
MAKRLRYPRRRIDVIPRGRDPEALGCRSKDRREGVRASLNISSDTPVVLAVARQEHQKGLDLLINAMPLVQQSVPGVRALVAGRQGAATATLEEQKRRTGAAIDFLGPRDDVPERLCAADVFVLPSRREGLPGALLEAMALECPAVVSDIPQHREVVDSTMALVVPADCPTALASAVASALSDSDAARERTRAGRRCFLSRFTIDAVTTEVVSFYERALGRSGRGDRG